MGEKKFSFLLWLISWFLISAFPSVLAAKIPKAGNGSFFSIILIPDTQGYTRLSKHNEIYFNQTKWIVENRDKFNIQLVIHLGDITNNNSKSEWQVAHKAHKILDDKGIAYIMVPGNHDIDIQDHSPDKILKPPRNYYHFRKYFPASRFGGTSWLRNCDSCSENNYRLFNFGVMKFLVIGLEIAPSKDAICWANKLINKFPFRRVMVITHCYQTEWGKHCKICDEHDHIIGADGQELWQEFISRHSNVFMVLSGHINGSIYLVKKGIFGNKVHQLLTDFQAEAEGRGWLRILTFYPNLNNGKIRSRILSTQGYKELEVKGWGPEGPGDPKKDYPRNPDHRQHKFEFDYNLTRVLPKNRFDSSVVGFNDRIVNKQGGNKRVKTQVAMDNRGNFVVVWQEDKIGRNEGGIFICGFYTDGCRRYTKIIPNPGERKLVNPAIAMDSKGNFVVVWEGVFLENKKVQIYAQGFKANGNERFPQKVITSSINGRVPRNPAIAMDSNSNFVLVWESIGNGNDKNKLYVQGFDASGNQRFSIGKISSGSGGHLSRPAIAMDSMGNFVIAGECFSQISGLTRIFAEGYRFNGNKQFTGRIINPKHRGQHHNPDIAMDHRGYFIVVWEGDRNNDNVYQIYCRRYNAKGRDLDRIREVNRESRGQQGRPAVTMNAQGDYIVAWEDDVDENGGYEIYARGFFSDGSESFSDKSINSDGLGHQRQPDVAINSKGYVVFVWQDYLYDPTGERADILARGFCFPRMSIKGKNPKKK